MLSTSFTNHTFHRVNLLGRWRAVFIFQKWLIVFSCALCSVALHANDKNTHEVDANNATTQAPLTNEQSAENPFNENLIIPGELRVTLSNFHELRGEYHDSNVSVKVRSKMSGAYAVDLTLSVDDFNLNASFDLVNESMVLDGHGAILSEDHKQAFTNARRHLISYLKKEFQDEYPEHSFLAVQMLGYWSRAPMNFPIGRREIATRS